MMTSSPDRGVKTAIDEKTIADFGQQWTIYQDNSGYYGSRELLRDIFGPLLDPAEIEGARIGDIGAGTGRIVNMLLDSGAAHVIAVEPSEAYDVLKRNTQDRAGRVTPIRGTGEAIPSGAELDLVTSIGVLHHVVDPQPIVAAAYAALRPGGKMFVWLYGQEGNRLYLAIFQPLRALTKRLPHALLAATSAGLNAAADIYILLCRFLPLPMRRYVLNVFARLARDKRYLIIYDQLNPAHAKYYNRREAQEMLEKAGFANISIHHRHGYSWSVIGEKPAK